MPDETDRPPVYERQAGARDGERAATFDDLNTRAVWRPPNSEELANLREHFDGSGADIDSLHVAVVDGYQSDHPGYAGPLAVVIGGTPQQHETVKLADLRDDGGEA